MEIIRVQCTRCGEFFDREAKLVRHTLKRGYTNLFCSPLCQRKYAASKRREFACAECGGEVLRSESQVLKSKSGRVFCSQSCAATYNNKAEPKRIANIKEAICSKCGNAFLTVSRKRCDACLNNGARCQDRTLDSFGSSRERHRMVRYDAGHVTKDWPEICAVTGYDKHVHTCHIIPIPKFEGHTLVAVVNDPRNLVLLSPNAHWELDHGELSIDDLPNAVAFREYEREVLEGGFVKNKKETE